METFLKARDHEWDPSERREVARWDFTDPRHPRTTLLMRQTQQNKALVQADVSVRGLVPNSILDLTAPDIEVLYYDGKAWKEPDVIYHMTGESWGNKSWEQDFATALFDVPRFQFLRFGLTFNKALDPAKCALLITFTILHNRPWTTG